jgi:pimeloyl-ACP methyl ester carboxylesterase
MATLDVPGARLWYEVRGAGPTLLLIPGGPADGGVFARIAPLLAAGGYRVVTYDPRGLTRSTRDEPACDVTVQAQAADASRLLAAVCGAEAACVFGNSGGAVTGLALAAGFSAQVRVLVAHEPPLMRLLPDGDSLVAAMADAERTYLREGAGPALGKFMTIAGLGRGEAPRPPAGALPNIDLFFRHMNRAIVDYRPDFAGLRAGPTRIVVGVGADSRGQVANRGALALSGRLGVAPIEFPGGHGGFMTDADAFAATLRRIFGEPD